MIARLSSDTLQDQRTQELSPKDSKKNKKLSPKFSRTKSGNAISTKLKVSLPPRSLSPPVVMTQTRPPQRYPPPPSSDPPNLFHHHHYQQHHYDPYEYTSYPRHIHQRSADGMSGVSIDSGSSVDSITHELASDRRITARNQLRDWVNSSSNGPQYFPTALGSQDTLDRSAVHHQHQYSLPTSRVSSLSRQQASILNPYKSDYAQPLDNLVTEAFQKQGGGSTWPTAGEQRGGWRYVKGPGSGVSSDGQQFSDVESMASSGCHSNDIRKPPLSPTTHVLVIEEQHNETVV